MNEKTTTTSRAADRVASLRHRWPAVVLAAALVAVAVAGTGERDRAIDVEFDDGYVLPESDTTVLLIDVADDLAVSERDALLAMLPGTPHLNSVHAADEGLYRLELPTHRVGELLERLETDPRIEHAEIEHEVSLFGDASAPDAHAAFPDDPLYPFQWNFEQIAAEDAWTKERGDGVVVAVIDTGVAYRTAEDRYRAVRDLGGTAITDGYDFVDDDEFADDEHGHGTHVAGTVAQTTNNGYGVAGVAPDAIIMPIRVLDAAGRGRTGDIADAIRFAADNGADVINLSLGGPLPSRVMADAVRHAHRQGVVVVAAAGNSSTSLPSFPAAYRNVIAVAATQFDRRTTFYSNYGKYIDIAAPGGNTRVDQNDDGRPDGILQETIAQRRPLEHEFALYMGTSMASPHVAGVAALLKSAGVESPSRVGELLRSSADTDVPSYDPIRYGAGIANADDSLTSVVSRHALPRTVFALLCALAIVGTARRRGGAGRISTPTTALAASVIVGGVPLLAALLALATCGSAVPFAVDLFALGDAWTFGASSTALLWSVALPLGLYALFGGVRQRSVRSVLIGATIGLGALFVCEAIVPLRDIAWVPGADLLDRGWLILHGAVTLGLARVALRG